MRAVNIQPSNRKMGDSDAFNNSIFIFARCSLEPNALVSFTPSDSMRLENPQNSSQSLPTVAPGGSQNVSWLIRADREANATLTFTLRNSSGTTVDTVSRAITITD